MNDIVTRVGLMCSTYMPVARGKIRWITEQMVVSRTGQGKVEKKTETNNREITGWERGKGEEKKKGLVTKSWLRTGFDSSDAGLGRHWGH
jgi:hypothetical protein